MVLYAYDYVILVASAQATAPRGFGPGDGRHIDPSLGHMPYIPGDVVTLSFVIVN